MKRRNHAGPVGTDTITTGKRRKRAVPVRDSTITTVCPCGVDFEPKRRDQKYHSETCRKNTYEQTDKAYDRRKRYWSTKKGKTAQRRYRESGATARNSRAYRARHSRERNKFDDLVRKHGFENLTFAVVFGDNPDQIPLSAAYRMFRDWEGRYLLSLMYKDGRPPTRLFVEAMEYLGIRHRNLPSPIDTVTTIEPGSTP